MTEKKSVLIGVTVTRTETVVKIDIVATKKKREKSILQNIAVKLKRTAIKTIAEEVVIKIIKMIERKVIAVALTLDLNLQQ